MPFGLDRQLLTIVPRDEQALPPLWAARIETALLGRAQIERGEHQLRITMYGTRDVVHHRLTRALASALGDGWEPLLYISVEPVVRSAPGR
jgi:hypothetical protein